MVPAFTPPSWIVAELSPRTNAKLAPQIISWREVPEWRNYFSVQSSASVWKLVNLFLETDQALECLIELKP